MPTVLLSLGGGSTRHGDTGLPRTSVQPTCPYTWNLVQWDTTSRAVTPWGHDKSLAQHDAAGSWLQAMSDDHIQ